MAISLVDQDFIELLKLCGVESCPDWDKAYGKFKEIKNRAVRDAIVVMVNDLYDLDPENLKRDVARITMADYDEDVRPEPGERQKLLRVLWWIFGVYFEGDYGELVRQCCRQAVFRSKMGS